MKKRKTVGKKYNNKNAEADELDHYDVSESDDGFDEDEKIMIDNARGRKIDDEEEEVFGVYESSDDEEDEEEERERDYEGGSDNVEGDDKGSDETDMESDLDTKGEDGDGLPDSKAWGTKRKDYYNTDYVDQDYLGFDDEDAALSEEREANEIQKRLIAELEGADFTLGLLETVEEKKKEIGRQAFLDYSEGKETIAKDLSKLSKQELLDILKTDSPGFLELMNITKSYCKKMKKTILPMLELCNKLNVPKCQAKKLLNAYKDCCSTFMLNVSFFINAKLSQTPNSEKHPVVKMIGQYLTLLRMMDNVMKEKGTLAQMKELIKKHNKGEELVIIDRRLVNKDVGEQDITGKNRKERRKKKLMLLQKKEKIEKSIKEKEKRLKVNGDGEVRILHEEINPQMGDKLQKLEALGADDRDKEGGSEGEEGDEVDEKRPITYQMMKNKGLTPKRKKEVRNPRVRNKNKFKKAVKNRRGQVRTVRKEISKYAGEMSGINKFVSKGIKIK